MSRAVNFSIEQRVSEAISYAETNCKVPVALHETDAEFFETLGMLDDDVVIEGLYEGAYQPSGNQVMVHTPDELAYALRTLDMELLAGIHPAYIAGKVQHEQQHGLAFLHLGMTAVRYGLAITGMTNKTVHYQLFSVGEKAVKPITKLQYAAITAIPTRLSEGDSMRLKLMGYRDINDLTSRIVAKNIAAGKAVIPAPFSSSSSH